MFARWKKKTVLRNLIGALIDISANENFQCLTKFHEMILIKLHKNKLDTPLQSFLNLKHLETIENLIFKVCNKLYCNIENHQKYCSKKSIVFKKDGNFRFRN